MPIPDALRALTRPLILFLALAIACTAPQRSGPSAPAAAPEVVIELDDEVELVPVGTSPCRGAADALVTVIEFTDFECSHCARAQETLQTLEQANPGDLRVCYKHRTIPLHFFSRDAAEAAEAAHMQGRFWEMHDLLFSHQQALGPDDLVRYAARIGLDTDRFNSDRLSEPVFKRVDVDEALAADLNVRSTPTFFINGRRLNGARPLAEFESLVAKGRADAERALSSGASRAEVYPVLLASVAARGERLAAPIPVEAGDPCRGPAEAPVTVIEVTDFECPFCGMAKSTLDTLEQAYGERLRLCVKLYPLSYHPHGRSAALFALAAHRQGKFFELYDDLFANQEALDDISIMSRVRDLGLDVDRLEADTKAPAVTQQLERHIAEVKQARVKGTPAFVINGRPIFGAKPYDEFKRVVDQQLAETTTRKK